jgi:hypothetical protein
MLKHFDRAELANHQILFRIIDGILIGKEGSEVKDVVRFFVKNAFQINIACNAAFDEQNIWQIRDAPLIGGRQIVQNNYFRCTCLGEYARKVAANCACAACDQDGFVFVSLRNGHAKHPNV